MVDLRNDHVDGCSTNDSVMCWKSIFRHDFQRTTPLNAHQLFQTHKLMICLLNNLPLAIEVLDLSPEQCFAYCQHAYQSTMIRLQDL